jgi:hypothetical protein
VAESAQALVDNLDDYAQVESNEEPEPRQELAKESPTKPRPVALPDGEGRVIACAGGRGELDDAAAAMLVQVLKAQGATANYIEHTSLAPGRIRQLSIDGLETIVIVFLNPSSVQHARYMTRRLKRSRPSLRVGVLLCNRPNDTIEPIKLIAEVGTGFVASTLAEAAAQSLEGPRPRPPMPPTKTTSRRKASSPKAKQTA